MSSVEFELLAFWSALTIYALVAVLAAIGLVFRKRPERTMVGLLALSSGLHTLAIGLRWERIGYVPVSNAFEMLSLNLWGLMLAVTLGYWLMPRVRAFAVVLMPVVIMIMAWMLLRPMTESALPPTYDTIWLFIHIGFIKLFLGCAFISLGMSGLVLLRRWPFWAGRLAALPDDDLLDARAYRFLALALIFDTLGIAAGAIWANDAWGRYWSWDKLETWSLVTWLSIGLSLHVRMSFRTAPRVNALLTVGVFVIAFFTFFGIPFVSTSLHKGQI